MSAIAALDAVSPDALLVLREMREGWGYPIDEIAANAGILPKRTREIMRAFHALGFAERHSFFSEDDCLIRGSGYSLSPIGGRLQDELAARSTPITQREDEA